MSLSINELIDVYREALEGVVPAVDRVGMPWRDGEAFDSWDLIEEALFQAIVLDHIEWHVSENLGEQPVAFPRGGFTHEDYAKLSTLVASSESASGGAWVLVGLPEVEGAFTHARIIETDAAGEVIPGRVKLVPLADLEWEARVRTEAGKVVCVTELPRE